ncbi:MAG: hypothetical protein WD513_07095, partial [Balneolaceae bacterium]
MTMRNIIGWLFISSVILLSACSTPETVTEEPERIEEQDLIPTWYDSTISSSSDSISFYGYSLVTATDSVLAIRLGDESALGNLRHEIDAFLEKTRLDLSQIDGGDVYENRSFIMKLRKAAQSIELSQSDMDREMDVTDEGIYHLYT